MDLIKDNKDVMTLNNTDKSLSSRELFDHIVAITGTTQSYKEFASYIINALSYYSDTNPRAGTLLISTTKESEDSVYRLTHPMCRIVIAGIPDGAAQVGMDVDYLFFGSNAASYMNGLDRQYGKQSTMDVIKDKEDDELYIFENPKNKEKVKGVTSLAICDMINTESGYDAESGLTTVEYNRQYTPQIKALQHKNIMESIRLYVNKFFPELSDKVNKKISRDSGPTDITSSLSSSLPNSYLDIGTATYQDSLNRNKSMYILTPDLATNFSSKLNGRISPKLKDLVNHLQRINSPFSRFPKTGASIEALQTNKPLPIEPQKEYFSVKEANALLEDNYSEDVLRDVSGRHHCPPRITRDNDGVDRTYHISVWTCAYNIPTDAWYPEQKDLSVFSNADTTPVDDDALMTEYKNNYLPSTQHLFD